MRIIQYFTFKFSTNIIFLWIFLFRFLLNISSECEFFHWIQCCLFYSELRNTTPIFNNGNNRWGISRVMKFIVKNCMDKFLPIRIAYCSHKISILASSIICFLYTDIEMKRFKNWVNLSPNLFDRTFSVRM